MTDPLYPWRREFRLIDPADLDLSIFKERQPDWALLGKAGTIGVSTGERRKLRFYRSLARQSPRKTTTLRTMDMAKLRTLPEPEPPARKSIKKSHALFDSALTLTLAAAFGTMLVTAVCTYETRMYAHQASQFVDDDKMKLATVSYKNAIHFDPKNIELYLLSGQISEKNGNSGEALKQYKEGLETAPENIDLLDHAGAAALRMGDYRTAVDCYDKLFQLSGERLKPHQIGNRAIALSRQGKFERALFDYLVLTRVDSGNKEAQLGVAHCLAQLGRHSEAISKLDQMIARWPEEPEARLLRGWCFQNSGKRDAAMKDFDFVVSRFPHNVRGHVYRANLLRIEGKLEIALAELNRALQLDGTNGEALLARAALLASQGRFRSAYRDYEDALDEGAPLDLSSGAQYVEAALQSGHYEDAVDQLSEMIEERSDYMQLYLLRASAEVKLGDFEEGIKDCDSVLSKHPSYAPALLQRALCHAGAGNKISAVNDFNSAIKADPRFVDAYIAFGNYQIDEGKFSAAVVSFDKALSVDSDNLAARKGKARANQVLLTGHGKSVDLKAEKIRTFKGLSETQLIDTGASLLKEGRVDEAKAAFVLAVKKNPNSQTARKYLARTLMISGNASAAESQLSALHKLGGSNIGDAVPLARSYLRSGQFVKARDILTAHLDKNKSDISAIICLADVYLAAGNPVEALDLCGTAMHDAKGSADYPRLERYYSTMRASLSRNNNMRGTKPDQAKFADTRG